VLYPTFGCGFWDPEWPASTLNLRDASNASRGLGHSAFETLDAFWNDPPSDLEDLLGAPDIVHSNNFFCPVTLSRARLVYTLHDIAFTEHPEWTTEANWRVCLDGVFNASLYADHVVAVSEYSRQQFLSTFPHYPSQRVSVVYEASRFDGPHGSPRPASLERMRPHHFWLTVGTSEPRKNQLRLIEAYARLRTAGRTADPLVLAGGSGWLMDDLARRIEALALGEDVIRLGYVDDATLRWLYENCRAFCYPSLHEGFGLPVVEAMSLGAAILTSATTSLPEVVGDAGLLVDPTDVEAIYAGLDILATDESLVERLRSQALERATRFSWQATARQVLAIYGALGPRYSPQTERNGLG
jgi:glycosyltransferase involved in cell wall biosynthesis